MTSHVGAALLALATALSDTDDLCMKDLPRADTTDPSAQARALTTCYERACATGDRNACDALTRIREEEWKTQYGAVRVGGQIKEPRRTRCVNLSADPQLAPRHGCYPLLLSVLIDTEGKVREAQIVTGVPQFRQAAVEAVKQWAYAPTTLEPGYGTAIPVIMTVTVPCPPAEACAVAHGCRGSSSAVRRDSRPGLWVALLFPAGHSVPIGRLQDDKWSNPWPQPGYGPLANARQLAWKDIPPSWFGGETVSPSWTAWWRDGSSRPLAFTEAVQMDEGCFTDWALKSPDFPQLSDSVHDESRSSFWNGVALLPTRAVDSVVLFQQTVYVIPGVVETCREAPAAEREILAAIRPRFERLETATLGRVRQNAPQFHERLLRLSTVERRRKAIVLHSLERTNTRVDGTELLHVSAFRTYGPAGAGRGQCLPESTLNAWLTRDAAGALTVLDASLDLGDTCRSGGYITEAVATVTYQTRTFLVTASYGFDGATIYGILELKDGRLVKRIESPGGGC